jgi:phage terminase large subunit
MFGTDKKAIEANWSPAQIDDSFADSPRVTLDIPSKLMFFMTENARFKVVHGGRGSGKSWGIARALIYKAHTEGGENGRPLYDAQHNRIKHLILCAREYQNSTADSAYRVIVNQIARMGLSDWFTIEKTRIISKITGAEFIFKGLWQNDNGIRSTEGITICWVEEAQVVSEYSWSILIPTIRGMVGAEIWVSYNPYLATDPTSVLFQGTDPKKPVDPRAIVVEMNHNDNPWFPPDMELDRKILLSVDPEAYEHVYGGAFLQLSEATIFRGNYEIATFETPAGMDRFYFGVDWGFANDPTFGTRSWIRDEILYIDYEAYGMHVELDDLHALLQGGRAEKNGAVFPGLPGIRDWPVKADNSRPETISYLRRGNGPFYGLNIEPATKWPGSIEDGIAHLKGFKKIIIHERCPRLAQEARLYQYKKDQKTGDILPIVLDKHNHGWDSVRYGLDGLIQSRGGLGVWAKLAAQI